MYLYYHFNLYILIFFCRIIHNYIPIYIHLTGDSLSYNTNFFGQIKINSSTYSPSKVKQSLQRFSYFSIWHLITFIHIHIYMHLHLFLSLVIFLSLSLYLCLFIAALSLFFSYFTSISFFLPLYSSCSLLKYPPFLFSVKGFRSFSLFLYLYVSFFLSFFNYMSLSIFVTTALFVLLSLSLFFLLFIP